MDTKINLELLDQQLASGEDAALTAAAREAAGMPRVDVEGRWARFGGLVRTNRRPSYTAYRFLGIAAAIIIAIVGIKYIPNYSTPESKTYTTTPGHIAKITLPSGAQVTLAPSTKLSVTGNDVTLNGLAAFTVLHNKSTPFSVKTANSTIQVLGTTFSVRSYDTEATRVIVAEGKVSANKTILSVGDAAQVSDNQISVQHGADIASALAWTEGRLVFDNLPFRETIAELEHWYGVKIEVRDKALLNRHIVTTLTTETPSQALVLIARTLDAHVEIVGERGGIRAVFTKL